MRKVSSRAGAALIATMALGTACGTSPGPDRAQPVSVQPIDLDALQAAIPEVSGWTRSKPTGERMTRPVRYAHVTATYTKDAAEIEAKLTDSAMNAQLLAPLTWMTNKSYARTTADGFERAATIDGHPALEVWNESSKSGEVDVVIDGRFIVEVEGRQLPDLADLRTFLTRIDLHALAGRK